MAKMTEEARATVILNGQQANATLKEIEAAARAVNAELKGMKTGTEAFAAKAKELQELNSKLAEIRAQTRGIGDEMNKQKGAMSGFFDNFKGELQSFGALIAGTFALGKIADYFKEGIQKALELRDTEKLLLDVLDGQKSTQRELIDLAKEKAQHSMSSRLEIEQAEKFLAIQGRTPEQIKKTIDAATDLAVVTKQTLGKAVEDLDGTMEGRLAKGLQKLSSQFKDLSKEQLYHGAAIDIIAKKYKGLAEEEMQTVTGKLNLLSKSWYALQRTLGEALLGTGGIFDGLVEGATKGLNALKQFFEIPVSEKIKQEQEALNVLVFQIQATNTNQKERNRLIEELRQKYPEFLSNIKDEDVSNQFLAKHLQDVNYQYMEKIRLAKSEESLKDIAEQQQKASDKLSASEQKRNKILSETMELFYQSNSAAAQLIENASTMDQKEQLVRKYINVTGASFLNACDNVRILKKEMQKGQEEFSAESIRLAEQAVSSSLNLSNSLDSVSDQILSIAVQTKDKNLQLLIQTEMEDRARQKRMIENRKTGYREDTDWHKMSVDELNQYISRGREADATNEDRTNMRKATAELDRRQKTNDKVLEKFKTLMDSIHEIEGKNFAEKLSQTQTEIRNVQTKYDEMIQRALKFKEENDKILTPEQKKEIAQNVSSLEVQKDAQIKQVLLQAEQQFSEDVKKIQENLRVARMSITNRQVYETKKKYDDARKEILDSIEYAYQLEIKAANGQTEKIAIAEKNKADAQKQIWKQLKVLKQAEQQDLNDVQKQADEKFEQDLANLQLKSETNLAKGKEKIALEVNAKYKKLLEENVDDEKKTAQIKEQIARETSARQQAYTKEQFQKMATQVIGYASKVAEVFSTIDRAMTQSENAQLQKDQDTNDQKKANLKKQLDGKVITQKQHDAQVEKLDKEMDAKKRKMAHDQAVRQKELSLVQAIINVAQGVTSALAMMPPASFIMAALTAVAGAIEIAYIASSKVPEAAKGRYNVIGKDDNKTYNNVPFTSSPETGLYSTPTLISETGAEYVIDPKTTRNLMINYPQVLDAIEYARVPQRSLGKYFDPSPSSTSPVQQIYDPSLAESINKLNAHLDKGIVSYLSYQHLMETQDKMNQIEAAVSKT